jgi:DNA-binding CsgD family transcriptional regulator
MIQLFPFWKQLTRNDNMPSEKKERNEVIFAMRNQGKTYAEIGEHFDMSRGNAQAIVSRVTMIKARHEAALERMKEKSVEEANLQDFFIINDASARLIGLSRWEEYKTVGDVLNTTEWALLKLPHINVETVKELKIILRNNGMDIKATTN